MNDLLPAMADYKAEPTSVYNSWFLNSNERLKAFRSIRRGVARVTAEIEAGTFGNDFKGSSLEEVLNVITEQKQVFEGAAHAFFWKPRLRIPDIYENPANQRRFGDFLKACSEATQEHVLIREIERLAQFEIKGLGPAVANILYFLHPTLMPPCNTAIVNGYNSIFGARMKLGSWEAYLQMREVLLATNAKHKQELSNDLGAFAGFLFDVGTGAFSFQGLAAAPEELANIEKKRRKRRAEVVDDEAEATLHTEMQYHLLRIGESLGYRPFVAMNDRKRICKEGRLSDFSLPELPGLGVEPETFNTIKLIDVLWLDGGADRVVAAFEVEKSTSIYSGILRLTDLALSCPEGIDSLYLAVPDARKREVEAQLNRPTIKATHGKISYIFFSDLREHCDAICRFGADHEVMRKIARTI